MGQKMGQQFNSRSSSRRTLRKRRNQPAPSSEELSKLYFDLLYLRQKVRIAETGQIVGRELTPWTALASFA
jgi:hypothetical protein